MLEQRDILEILGISNREDSFTDLIKYLFDNNDEFKASFSEKFLEVEEIANLEDLTLFSRKSYVYKINKKIIPDLILHSKSLNKISIIEVKVLSGQGLNQLERYEKNIDIIIGKIGLDKDIDRNYYYLSINDDSEKNINWKHINWKDLYNIFDIKTKREDINYLIQCVLNRINSLNTTIDYKKVKDNSFNDYLKWNLWKSPAKAIKEIVETSVFYTSKLNEFKIEYSTNFAVAENSTQTNIYVLKDEWISDLEYCDYGSNINNCFDFHIEIRISSNEKESDIAIRLDHHINPYASNKKMKEESRYNEFYKDKRAFISDMKFNKYKDLGKSKGYRYNQATGHYLSIIRRDVKIENNKSVEDFMSFLTEEINYLSVQLELFKDELINFS